MDRHYWRNEAAMLRREGQHMLDGPDELDRAAQEQTRDEPQDAAPKSSRFEVLAALVVGGIGVVGLGILAWWQSL